jgi:hypothetical protein
MFLLHGTSVKKKSCYANRKMKKAWPEVKSMVCATKKRTTRTDGIASSPSRVIQRCTSACVFVSLAPLINVSTTVDARRASEAQDQRRSHTGDPSLLNAVRGVHVPSTSVTAEGLGFGCINPTATHACSLTYVPVLICMLSGLLATSSPSCLHQPSCVQPVHLSQLCELSWTKPAESLSSPGINRCCDVGTSTIWA